jgi:hypothetical protein
MSSIEDRVSYFRHAEHCHRGCQMRDLKDLVVDMWREMRHLRAGPVALLERRLADLVHVNGEQAATIRSQVAIIQRLQYRLDHRDRVHGSG